MAAAVRRGARRVDAVRNPRSLGVKLVVILTAVGVTGALAIAALLGIVIAPAFDRLELKSVDQHVDRTRAALTEYASKVESAVRDYGDWNDSYAYMASPTRRFEQESFSTLAMGNLDVDGMAYIGTDRRVVIARWIDADRREQPAMRARLTRLAEHMRFDTLIRGRNAASFYARLGSDVAAIGVAQVRRSDGSGAPRGYVLMARPITSERLSDLLQLRARVDLVPASGIVATSTRRLGIAVPIVGADGRDVASARFVVPRDVSGLGRRMLLLAIGGSVLLLLLVLAVLRRMIARQVLAPLARMEAHMQRVRVSGSLGVLAEDGRKDEIGSLGNSFNAMLRQLKDLREQIEAQSFALGRSESAVAVMHNVRNALNPISTILSQGVALPPPVDRATLDRAIGELGREDMPAMRRRKLTAFVAAAVEAEAQAREAQRGELQVGREAMVHVLEIIGQQQQAAHERPQLAVCDVTEIVAQNATIARYSGKQSIAFSFPAAPCPVLANRVILSQVIGNLFSNAAEAIVAGRGAAGDGAGGGSIMVTFAQEAGGVVVRIRDDGEGFDPGAVPALFRRGFSTRQHKSGGLGLHWCANSMTAMAGSLALESAGKGTGAVAVLTLRAPDAVAVAVAVAA